MRGALRSYIPIHKALEQPCRHFTSRKRCKCYQSSHPSLRVASTPNKQKPITIDLIVYKQTIHTKLCHFARVRSEWKLSNPWGDSLLFSFHLINLRNKKIKPYIHQAFLFRSATPGTKRTTHLSDDQLDKTNTSD